jgi:hypothetical protein
MAESADGFLGRWARRKNDALQGKPLDEPVPAGAVPADGASLPAAAKSGSDAALPAETTTQPVAKIAELSEPIKPLTLDDVKDLTKESDFKPFMSRGVEPGVRNAAMKKLFADPHFNVMDGLDIYIDDYSKPDPLPLSMLRQMASAKFLKLFDDEEEDAQKAQDAAALPNNVTETDPQPEAVTLSAISQEDHAHIDLRLQPDHAAEGPDIGRGAA